MWCTSCRQDVRGVCPQGHPEVRCARCGLALVNDDAAPGPLTADSLAYAATHGVDLTQPPAPVSRYPSFDDWKIDQTLRELQARVAPVAHARDHGRGGSVAADRTATWRTHASHRAVRPAHAQGFRRDERSRIADAAMLWLCLAAFAAGATLLTRSFVADRFELWGVSLPLALCGQLGLFVAVALQLERIWRNSRDAVRLLEHVDSNLRRLHRARFPRAIRASDDQAASLRRVDEASLRLLPADFGGNRKNKGDASHCFGRNIYSRPV